VLLLSCGFTVSYVHCSKGSQWVLGSKMPSAKHHKKTSLQLKNNSLQESNEREIDTYQFSFEFDSEISSLTQKIKKINTFSFEKQLIYFSNNTIETELRVNQIQYNPPPNINQPCLIRLQTFII